MRYLLAVAAVAGALSTAPAHAEYCYAWTPDVAGASAGVCSTQPITDVMANKMICVYAYTRSRICVPA